MTGGWRRIEIGKSVGETMAGEMLQSLVHSLSLWYVRSLESERKIFWCEWRRMAVAFVGGWLRVDGPLGLRTSHVDSATTRYGLDGLVFASVRTREADCKLERQ